MLRHRPARADLVVLALSLLWLAALLLIGTARERGRGRD